MGSRPRWIAATWNELEPILREDLRDLELTEFEHAYGGEWVKVARDQVDVTRDILNALEARGFYLMKQDLTQSPPVVQ